MSQQSPNSQLMPVHIFWNNQRQFNSFTAINGGIDLGVSTQTGANAGTQYTGNVNGQWVNVQAPAGANTEFAIPHTLGRIPSFYWFISDVACNLYQLPNTGTAWTQTNIYLKCSAGNANLRIFIT